MDHLCPQYNNPKIYRVSALEGLKRSSLNTKTRINICPVTQTSESFHFPSRSVLEDRLRRDQNEQTIAHHQTRRKPLEENLSTSKNECSWTSSRRDLKEAKQRMKDLLH
jgi:hypothetical protein